MGSVLDMHFHTQETSSCGSIPAAQSVPAYREKGYDGLVVTDHYFDGYFARFPADRPWPEQLESWLTGYRAARAAGDACGMTVLLGLELRFVGSMNDYLVYGATEDLLRAHPALYRMDPASFARFARDNGLFFAQAHPFRPGLTRCDAAYLDGVETYNGNKRHNSHNDLAAAYAAEHGLIPLSGSDFHEWEDLARGGLHFRAPVRDAEELIAALRGGAYEPITTGD